MLKKLFELRGQLSKEIKLAIELVGFVTIFGLWWLVSEFRLVPPGIFPHPFKVIASFGELYTDNALIVNAMYSMKINFLGYAEAVALALPLGFLLGLFPVFRCLSERLIAASRFLPLPAVMGVLIAAFGIGTTMKVQFLTLGIFVYLLPTVVQRIDEVPEVYVQTAKTIGANKLQTIYHVFFKAAIYRIFDDIRVLVAISWTYIVIAEMVNMADGGLGALTFAASRQSRVDKIYALLVIIMLIGFVQDKIFGFLDRVLFPHKYA